MKPPFRLTPKSLNLVSEITRELGKIDATSLTVPEPKLRKQNRIKTVRSTLAIEGNSFNLNQITAILEGKRVIGNRKEILEVKNTLSLYEKMNTFKVSSTPSFLKAHGILMKDLIKNPGSFRTKNVGILKGSIVKHLAPKPTRVPELMDHLFSWVKNEKELHALIKSSIVHYEIEFIHPFEDGNGRMGRFWQSLILSEYHPLFRYIPFETLIEKNQKHYYRALELSDKKGDSTHFIEWTLSILLDSVKEFGSEVRGITSNSSERLKKAKTHFGKGHFSRKNYMELFKEISSSTASRDLKEGIEENLLRSKGKKNQTRYRF